MNKKQKKGKGKNDDCSRLDKWSNHNYICMQKDVAKKTGNIFYIVVQKLSGYHIARSVSISVGLSVTTYLKFALR